MKRARIIAAIAAAVFLFAGGNAMASQATWVTPATSPLPMTSLATFLNNAFQAVGTCSAGTSAPTVGPSGAPIPYMCWWNTTASPPVLEIYNGSSWASLGITTYGIQGSAGSPSIAQMAISAVGVDFNVGNTDTIITLPLTAGFTNYIINSIVISNASASLTSATVGVFTGPGATGTQLVAAGTAVTVSTSSGNANNNAQTLTLQNVGASETVNYSPLHFRVQTPEGSPATATVTISIRPLS